MKGDPLEWVYFKRLARDAYKPKKRPELATLMAEGGSAVAGAHVSVTNSSRNGDQIIAMAQAELAKEQQFLQQVFGVNLNVDFSQPGAIKTLIETINACLNLKEIYERNREVIKQIGNGGKAQKGVFTYFHTYVLQAFEKRRINIRDKVIRRFLNGKGDFYDAVKAVLDDEFDKYILPDAIELMFNANPEYGLDPKYKNAYQDFLQGLRALPNNQYTAQLKSAWKIDTLISDMAESIAKSTNTGDISNKFKKYGKNKEGHRVNGELRTMINKIYTNNASGLSLEHLFEAGVSMMAAGLTGSTIAKNNNSLIIDPAKVKVVSGVGQKNARPDGMVIFNANASKVENIINNSSFKNRQDAIDAFNNIGRYLERLKDGFIVYTNAKNFTLNENFIERKGFSAGGSISLKTLEPILSNVITDIDELEAVILNAGHGAINEGNKGDASTEIAKAIAYALFDDWNYIGQLPKNSSFALHVFDLNGILIPLSTFLYGFGSAINGIIMSPTSFVKAQINVATYDTSNAASYGMEFWEKNPTVGRDNTTIEFHFLRDFASLVAQFL